MLCETGSMYKHVYIFIYVDKITIVLNYLDEIGHNFHRYNVIYKNEEFNEHDNIKLRKPKY